ncbi:hypothetical protein Lalb_Chr16g0380501 [Lupinus albus]|uniref:Uncharacterized protein n=1 Tax=Lupinus albus TaxID=3870 RepID=A0A6A4PB40_LUPAL|nr:hypothetical protein Lalb_Chr16g0380501 [Lupinus albus]
MSINDFTFFYASLTRFMLNFNQFKQLLLKFLSFSDIGCQILWLIRKYRIRWFSRK